jgi:hypothetical protein
MARSAQSSPLTISSPLRPWERPPVPACNGGPGAGNANTLYWAFQSRLTEARDIGHRCKECQREFLRVGDTMFIRRGGRIELRYHEHCFSGSADPRTQGRSSFTTSGHSIAEAAPTNKFRKMRSSSQF